MSIDRNVRSRLIFQAERMERRTKAAGRPSGVLGQTGLAILRVLLFRFSGSPTPSYVALRTATGFAFDTISGALKRLEAAGFLLIERRTRRTPQGNRVINNRYGFPNPPDSVPPGLIPADVERRKPESFIPWEEWKSPVKDALDALGKRMIERSMLTNGSG